MVPLHREKSVREDAEEPEDALPPAVADERLLDSGGDAGVPVGDPLISVSRIACKCVLHLMHLCIEREMG